MNFFLCDDPTQHCLRSDRLLARRTPVLGVPMNLFETSGVFSPMKRLNLFLFSEKKLFGCANKLSDVIITLISTTCWIILYLLLPKSPRLGNHTDNAKVV